jgi:hypothetical protein
MPFDAARQQFWMDLSFSSNGFQFSRVHQDPESSQGGASHPPNVAIPNGELGSWNGGLLMGTAPPIVVGETTFSLLEFAQSGPHFSFIWHTADESALTPAAVEATVRSSVLTGGLQLSRGTGIHDVAEVETRSCV